MVELALRVARDDGAHWNGHLRCAVVGHEDALARSEARPNTEGEVETAPKSCDLSTCDLRVLQWCCEDLVGVDRLRGLIVNSDLLNLRIRAILW